MISGWSDPIFARIAGVVERRTGLAFGPGREAVAEAGIRRAMARAGLLDPRRYLDAVEGSLDATPDSAAPVSGERPRSLRPLDDLADELTVGETHFFRHPEQLAVLRSRILPELVRARPPDHVLRVWSAGCATGEEPYTLAIILHELGLGERARVVATDISRGALAAARRGVYKSWSLRGTPEEMRRAHFVEEGGLLAVRPRYRGLVAFEHGNLALDAPPPSAGGVGGLDLVFCRNVILYFSPETIRAVARRLHGALAAGGFLVMGPSDAPLWDLAPFETLTTPAGIVYRRPERDPVQRSAAAAAGPPPAPPPAPEARASLDPPRPRAALDPPVPAPPADARELAAAFSRGDFAVAIQLARALAHDPAACAVGVRAVAALRGVRAAEAACAEAALRHPLSVELCLLRALLSLELGRLDEAAEAARRAVYLDPRSPIAHFTAATIARRRADREGARRGYRNARALAAALDPGAVVPLSEGERAGRLAEAAAAQLALLRREA